MWHLASTAGHGLNGCEISIADSRTREAHAAADSRANDRTSEIHSGSLPWTCLPSNPIENAISLRISNRPRRLVHMFNEYCDPPLSTSRRVSRKGNAITLLSIHLALV